MKITEPVQDFEFHAKGCETCADARRSKVDRYCSMGRQLRDRALRSLYWKVKA